LKKTEAGGVAAHQSEASFAAGGQSEAHGPYKRRASRQFTSSLPTVHIEITNRDNCHYQRYQPNDHILISRDISRNDGLYKSDSRKDGPHKADRAQDGTRLATSQFPAARSSGPAADEPTPVPAVSDNYPAEVQPPPSCRRQARHGPIGAAASSREGPCRAKIIRTPGSRTDDSSGNYHLGCSRGRRCRLVVHSPPAVTC
jgi:hypothetical protein